MDNQIPPSQYKPDVDEYVFNCTGVMNVRLANKNDEIAKYNQQVQSNLVLPGIPIPWSDHAQCANDGTYHTMRVSETFQLEGFPNIFAIGDGMSEPAQLTKEAHYAEMHAMMTAENLIRLELNETIPKAAPLSVHSSSPKQRFTALSLLAYPVGFTAPARNPPRLSSYSMGQHDGVLFFNSLIITGRIAAYTKRYMVEWTKMWQYKGNLIGIWIWKIADEVVLQINKLSVFSEINKEC